METPSDTIRGILQKSLVFWPLVASHPAEHAGSRFLGLLQKAWNDAVDPADVPRLSELPDSFKPKHQLRLQGMASPDRLSLALTLNIDIHIYIHMHISILIPWSSIHVGKKLKDSQRYQMFPTTPQIPILSPFLVLSPCHPEKTSVFSGPSVAFVILGHHRQRTAIHRARTGCRFDHAGLLACFFGGIYPLVTPPHPTPPHIMVGRINVASHVTQVTWTKKNKNKRTASYRRPYQKHESVPEMASDCAPAIPNVIARIRNKSAFSQPFAQLTIIKTMNKNL